MRYSRTPGVGRAQSTERSGDVVLTILLIIVVLLLLFGGWGFTRRGRT
jgi:hypothetical protein